MNSLYSKIGSSHHTTGILLSWLTPRHTREYAPQVHGDERTRLRIFYCQSVPFKLKVLRWEEMVMVANGTRE